MNRWLITNLKRKVLNQGLGKKEIVNRKLITNLKRKVLNQGLGKKEIVHPPPCVTCQVSHIRCQVSGIR